MPAHCSIESPVRLTLQSYGREHAVHAHGWHQLVLPLSGVLEMEVDGQGGRVARGTLAWIGRGCRHGFRAEGANRFVVADVPSGLAALAGLSVRHPFLPHSPGLARAAVRLAQAGDGDGAVRRLLAALLRDTPGGDALRRVEAAMARMRADPAMRHPTGELAAAVGLRRARFHDLFVAATGLTPRAWLGELRLDRAEALLRGSRMTLAEVALACGYSEQSALTRALARERGLTPGQLRRDAGATGR